MNIIRYACLCLFFLTSNNNRSFAQYTPQEYIETYKRLAIEVMEKFGIPASVTMGIAMCESANGNSKVANYLHNHFGIKGPNNSKEIRSAYKGYDSVEASYHDFVNYLSTRKQFKSLFEKYTVYDYKNWVYGIGRGGYAVSRAWANHVIATIHKYRLFELDNRPSAYEEPEDVAVITEEIPSANQIYTVKKGDTLSGIAKRHHMTVVKLRQQNGLKTDRLKIGQHLKI